jgi:hypothetical protein
MPNSISHQDAQLLARVTVLERVVGLMLRDGMLEAGKGAGDILTFGEDLKKYFHGRTAEGSTDRELNDAADRFFSAIASDIGSQDSQ